MTTPPAAAPDSWSLDLAGMDDPGRAMARIDAWYQHAVLDRPPVRFQAHNAFVEEASRAYPSGSLRERWFDVEFQVETYAQSIAGRRWHGETFPVFWPNLGPEVYAAFYGARLEYGDVTSWSVPLVRDWKDMASLALDLGNEYGRTLDALTQCALERLNGKSLVGYTDLHPGVDCAAAWRDPAQLCLDLIEAPEQAEQLIHRAIDGFETVYDHFDDLLKAGGQPSITWMGIPSLGRMHIPSCDFSSLISPRFFERFALPVLQREVQTMTHNIFHVDGVRVARHLDMICSVPQVHAIQWVQGVGDDLPIMQWVPLIKRIQALRPVIVDLNKRELEPFMEQVAPEGIFLWIATDSEEEEQAILKRVAQWTKAEAS